LYVELPPRSAISSDDPSLLGNFAIRSHPCAEHQSFPLLPDCLFFFFSHNGAIAQSCGCCISLRSQTGPTPSTRPFRPANCFAAYLVWSDVVPGAPWSYPQALKTFSATLPTPGPPPPGYGAKPLEFLFCPSRSVPPRLFRTRSPVCAPSSKSAPSSLPIRFLVSSPEPIFPPQVAHLIPGEVRIPCPEARNHFRSSYAPPAFRSFIGPYAKGWPRFIPSMSSEAAPFLTRYAFRFSFNVWCPFLFLLRQKAFGFHLACFVNILLFALQFLFAMME